MGDPARSDLAAVVAGLGATRRPGVFTFVTVADDAAVAEHVVVHASVREAEGLSLVVEVGDAERAGWPVGYRAAWLSFSVQSDLELVGLTAAVATALAGAGISANVIAGHHHDHVLVAEDDADEALAVLAQLAAQAHTSEGSAGDQPNSSA